MQFEELRRYVEGGQVNGDDEGKDADESGEGRAEGRHEIIFARLKIFDEQVGQGERDGRAVDENTDPSFQHLGGKNIRLFGRARLFEQGMPPSREEEGDVRRVGHAVDVDVLEAGLYVAHDFVPRNVLEITKDDFCATPPSDRNGFEEQFGRLDPRAQERHIGLDVLDKARPRALDGDVGGRFGHGAQGHGLDADDQGTVKPVDEKHGIAVEDLFRERSEIPALLVFGRGNGADNAFKGFLSRIFAEGLGYLFAQKLFIGNAVREDRGAFPARRQGKSKGENVLRRQELFELLYVFS